MISRIILFFICLLTVSSVSIAQPYSTGLGVRLGGLSNGLTVKHFTGTNGALEGILGFSHSSFFITGLYEWHQPFGSTPGLAWYYGGGGHIAFYSADSHHFFHKHHDHPHWIHDHEHESETGLGLDLILGLEYKLQRAPVAFSLDLKPRLEITPGFHGHRDGGLSIRFTL